MKAVKRALSACTKAEFNLLSGGADVQVYMEAFYAAAHATAEQFTRLGISNIDAEFVLHCEPSNEDSFSRDNPADVAVLAFESAVRTCHFLIRDTYNFHSEIIATVRNILCGPLSAACDLATGVNETSYPAAQLALNQITDRRSAW